MIIKVLFVFAILSFISCFVVILAALFNPSDWDYSEDEDDEQIEFLKKWRQEKKR